MAMTVAKVTQENPDISKKLHPHVFAFFAVLAFCAMAGFQLISSKNPVITLPHLSLGEQRLRATTLKHFSTLFNL